MRKPAGSSNLFSRPLRALQELPGWRATDGDITREDLEELIERLDAVRTYAATAEERFADQLAHTAPQFRDSARNLLHYLSLRHYDLRSIQDRLSALGLSSLGRTEAHTLASLYAVRQALERAGGMHVTHELEPEPGVAFHEGDALLATNTVALLGEAPQGRRVRIMVTLPTEAARNYALVRDLVAAGMDCARINCAHDDAVAWRGMVDHIEQARDETGRSCKIFMDLAGPKLRTGPLEPGPQVLRWRPKRDVRGRVVAPARIWFGPPGVAPPADVRADAVIPVPPEWIAGVRTGDTIEFLDARDSHRKVDVVASVKAGFWGEARKTAYVETGIELRLSGRRGSVQTARVGELPNTEIPIVLSEGETLVLHTDPAPGAPAVRAADGTVLAPAHVACTYPEIFKELAPGHLIAFDDGKIQGVVRSVTDREVHVEITLARPNGSRLRGDKGINFPEATLRGVGLTEKDLADLDFLVDHADGVGMSFVNEPADVERLQDELRKRGRNQLGIILKIETRSGFRRLPWLLLAAMRTHPVGVMIARGDLAIECGWERLAEAQEEILWFCEAAHVPVIWATQVLENLAKTGLPSRAEITDAAMAERAECVMLNKGPYVTKAVRVLDDILRRMQEHQAKKTARLRNLTLAGDV